MSFYVYRFLNMYGDVLYVGKTTNIKSRISKHLNDGHLPDECYDELYEIEYIELPSKIDMDIAELYLINKFNTPYNKHSNQGSETEIDIYISDEWILYWNRHRDKPSYKMLERERDYYRNLSLFLETKLNKLTSINNTEINEHSYHDSLSYSDIFNLAKENNITYEIEYEKNTYFISSLNVNNDQIEIIVIPNLNDKNLNITIVNNGHIVSDFVDFDGRYYYLFDLLTIRFYPTIKERKI